MLQNVSSQPGVNYMSQINFTDALDSQIPMWGTMVNKGFPTVGYNVTNSSVVSLGKYALHSSPNTAEATYSSITLNTVPSGGQAIAFGIDIGYYIALSQGLNTWGIPRDYSATYEPGYDTFLRLIKSMYAQAAYVTIWPVPSNMGVHLSGLSILMLRNLGAMLSTFLNSSNLLVFRVRSIGKPSLWRMRTISPFSLHTIRISAWQHGTR
jgi:hypothetical protein